MLTDPTDVEREMADLLRSVMEEATGRAPLPGDLVAGAVVQGRRRRARRQVALGAGVTAVMALGILASTSPWPDGGTTPAVTNSDPDLPFTVDPDILADAEHVDGHDREPVHVEPSPGEFSMADLPAAERKIQVEFQQGVAEELDDMLYTVGEVHPVDLRVSQYQLKTGEFTFPLTFSVRPADGEKTGEQKCEDVPAKQSTCYTFMMRGGIWGTARTAPVNSEDTTGVRISFTYQDNLVDLSVAPDDEHGKSSPVAVEKLRQIAQDGRITLLVRYAVQHPMEGM
ncbi:hypothetical protein [Streptomyces sp. NBC_00102]|uniref:hypothetical protein n=1 Tax=Streptomyces sp. NBC_00102 TaxID=2975652 RepID=UPI0022568704|nr:hypothetical protein [Streptomyces sp. NBC_00102]MCX5397630.1 hypothetical protein [Streptomyces sp. NBC_00102]